MKLSKYLKEKYWETIYFNMQAIRRRHAEIIRLSSSVGSKKGYSLYSANFFSEQLIKKYVEKDMLKIHHETFLYFIKTKYAYIEKVHSRKTFPLSLRDHIFSRDNYCCQLCGISNTVAIINSHYLEVVHIKDLSEGGNTSFSNGQTICSKCNKGRNSAKKQKASSKSKRKLIKT